jgi:hypothetical protein
MTYDGGRGRDLTEFGDYFRTQRWNQGPVKVILTSSDDRSAFDGISRSRKTTM